MPVINGRNVSDEDWQRALSGSKVSSGETGPIAGGGSRSPGQGQTTVVGAGGGGIVSGPGVSAGNAGNTTSNQVSLDPSRSHLLGAGSTVVGPDGTISGPGQAANNKGDIVGEPAPGDKMRSHTGGPSYTVGSLDDPGTQVNRSDFQVEGGLALQDALNKRQQSILARQGPAAGTVAQVAPTQYAPLMQAQAAQVGPMAQAQQSDVRGNQLSLIDQLSKYATGKESVSQLQLKQAADQNIAQQMAMAASARPGGGGMAARMASQNAGNINTQLAGQSAIAGLQERQANAAQLQQLLGTARGQDESLGQFNAGQTNAGALAQAGFANQTGLANMQSGNAYNLADAQTRAAAASQQAQLQQNQGQFDTSAGLQFQGQQDQAMRDALSQQGMLSQLGLQGTMGYQAQLQARTLSQTQLAQQLRLAQMGIDASKVKVDQAGNIIGGAAGGAAAGSAFGPWGALGGGIIGGVAGAFK